MERNSRLMGLDDDHIPVSPPSLKSKLKDSLCFYCCFRRRHHGHSQVLDSPTGRPTPHLPSDDKPTLLWLKTRKAHDLKDDIKDKCMMVFGRVGNGISRHHKRHQSSEFRYDPLSYSLNFEDGFEEDDEYPLRNISAKLALSSKSRFLGFLELGFGLLPSLRVERSGVTEQRQQKLVAFDLFIVGQNCPVLCHVLC